ncbi:hypothetical protein Tco_0906061 [Tanacetum coccineum]
MQPMAACKEIEELTKARILRKAKCQTWVANPVMVKKSDGGWRICVDFTDINKPSYARHRGLTPTIGVSLQSKFSQLAGRRREDKTALLRRSIGVLCVLQKDAIWSSQILQLYALL